LSSQRLVQDFISCSALPRKETLEKLYTRYPVRKQWLEKNEDEMWELDYYTNRFYKIGDTATTVKGKVELLMLVFENTQSQLSRRSGVSKTVLHDLLNGTQQKMTENTIEKFSESISFIPKSWYNI